MVEGVDDVVGGEGLAVAPGDVGAGLDGEGLVIGRVLVALGQPHRRLVDEGAVEGQRLAGHVRAELVVGRGEERDSRAWYSTNLPSIGLRTATSVCSRGTSATCAAARSAMRCGVYAAATAVARVDLTTEGAERRTGETERGGALHEFTAAHVAADESMRQRLDRVTFDHRHILLDAGDDKATANAPGHRARGVAPDPTLVRSRAF